MSLHKRLAFQRTMLERRSLRVPPASGGGGHNSILLSSSSSRHAPPPKSPSKSPKSKSKVPSVQTPLDLQLDLAAQQTKLLLLNEEIHRLKDIKKKMEECKTKGNKEVPTWLQESEQLQNMMAKVGNYINYGISCKVYIDPTCCIVSLNICPDVRTHVCMCVGYIGICFFHPFDPRTGAA